MLALLEVGDRSLLPNWLYGVTLVALGRQKLETLGLVLGTVVGLAVAYRGDPGL